MTIKELSTRLKTKIAAAADAQSPLQGSMVIIGTFLVIAALGMAFKPNGFLRYFTGESLIFDIGHYHAIANGNYNSVTVAFYPLWPLIIRTLSNVVSPDRIVLFSSLVAAAIFFFSIPVLIRSFRGAMPRQLAVLLVACFAFNPNSLFHVLSYPESATTLLSGLILFSGTCFLLEGKKHHLALVFLYFTLFSFARPVLAQVISAGVAAIAICRILGQREQRREWGLTITAITAAIVGYVPYGIYCLNTLGNFFAPFAAQAAWDRKLGIYWSLIFAPKAVSNSDVVLLWDLQAFYGPALVAILLVFTTKRLFKKNRDTPAPQNPRLAYLAWFSILFAGSHSAIAFLTHPIFLSTGRHVFALPFVFYAVGYAIADRWEENRYRRCLLFYAFFSAIYLLNWWERYARAGWIG